MRGAAVLLLLLPACGPIAGGETEEAQAIDRDAAREVVSSLLAALEEACEADGPAFASRIPEIKDRVAEEHGLGSWDRFGARLRRTDPDRDVEVAGEITRTIHALLERSAEGEETEER